MRAQGAGHRRARSADHAPAGIDREDVVEAGAFLCWLEDHNFTFLGYRDYDIVQEDGEVRLAAVPGTGPGHPAPVGGAQDRVVAGLRPPSARRAAPRRSSPTSSTSRRPTRAPPSTGPPYLDYVGVKRFDADGKVIGERRFLGLYTHTAYQASPREIPILRRKVDAVLARAAFPPGSHNEKALIQILESHPRDELIQASVDELFDIAMGILHLGERQRVRLFVRPDAFGRFLSCLVFVPRDRFNTDNRRRIERILREAFDAHEHRLHHARLGVGARPPALHALRRARADAPARHRRDRAPDPRGHALVGRRPGAGAGRGARRGARQRAVPALGRRLPDGLPRRLGGALGGGRHHAHREPGRGRPRAHPLPPARGGARRPAGEGVSRRARRSPSRTCCRCSRTWACRSPTSGPYELKPRDGAAGLDLRLRPHLRGRAPGRADPRDLPGRVHPRLARRGRERRLQPPRPARRG